MVSDGRGRNGWSETVPESYVAKAVAAHDQARRAIETSDPHAAVMRSWFAVVHALRAGLLATDADAEGGHPAELIANFGIRVVAGGVVPLDVGKAVMDVYAARSAVEAGEAPAPEAAVRTVERAAHVVDAVRTALDSGRRRDSGTG